MSAWCGGAQRRAASGELAPLDLYVGVYVGARHSGAAGSFQASCDSCQTAHFVVMSLLKMFLTAFAA